MPRIACISVRRPSTRRDGAVLLCLLTAAAGGLLGCEKAKEDVKKQVQSTVQRTQTQVKKTVEVVKQQANIVGSIELALKEPLSIKACYATLAVLPPPRQGILQLTSYKVPDQESFPSVFLRAPVDVGSPEELAGRTVRAQMYVQFQSGGAVWYTPPEGLVEVTIQSVEQQAVTAELTGGTIVNAQTKERIDVKGKMTAVY